MAKRKKPRVSATFEASIDEQDWKSMKSCCGPWHKRHATGGGAYFLGFLGAAIYYISTATGFWNGVLGFLKAMIWPFFVVYELLKYLAA